MFQEWFELRNEIAGLKNEIEHYSMRVQELEAQLAAQPMPEAIIKATLKDAARCAMKYGHSGHSHTIAHDILNLDYAAIIKSAVENLK